MARLVRILILALCVSAAVAVADDEVRPRLPGDGNFCQGCRSIVSFLATFNESSQRTEYEDVIKNYCEFYYPASTDFQQGPCPLFVKGFYAMLERVDPVHHCDQIGACGSARPLAYSLAPELLSMPPKQADVVCKFCEQSVEQVQNALSNPETVEQVRRQVNQFCDYLKVVEADKECRQLANKYLDEALKFVRGIDPLAYCRSAQLCSARATARPLAKKSGASGSRVLDSTHKPARELPTLADFNDFGIETSVIIGPAEQQQPLQQQLLLKSAPGCALCKTLVKEMFHFLRENKTEANIVSGLNQVCHLVFPSGDKLEECRSMVRAYTRELIQLLIDETDPEMICILIEQCLGRSPSYALIGERPTVGPAPAAPQPPKASFNLGDLIHSLDPSTKLKSAKVCIECKMFIKYLRNVFDEPSSREAIKSWLVENLCQSIPDKETSDQCRRLVDDYADTFFAAVMGNLNPASACAELGACTRKTLAEVLHIDITAPVDRPDELPSLIVSPKLVAPPSERRRPQNQRATICDQCVQIVTQIDEYLANHPIDKDVSVLIDQVCNKMPEGSVRDECAYMIEMFGTKIAQAVSTMENPRQLCAELMLC